MLYNSWSVSVRHMWDVPVNTHRYFVEPLGGPHAKTMIQTRYIKFMQSINQSKKPAAKHLYEFIKKNTKTITGQNIRNILINTDTDDIMNINANCVKSKLQFRKIPSEEKWRISVIKELTDVKQNMLEVKFSDNDNLTHDEIADIINFVTTT